MKKLIITVAAIFSAVTAAQIVAQIVRSRRCIEDQRWQNALAEFKAARERRAPQVEIERTKRQLGRVFSQLQAKPA
jgi:hypothetical protein